jgi:exoribonuclease R
MSVFLPERSFHMLPDPISRAASLEEFRDRPTETLTVALKIEKNGAILDYKVAALGSIY